ncbi:hypothetical protein ACIQNU_21320 [Streptomyces sp. NPDC091292]|uniref:hypothetical protein n=1 Tax=Streptomyces sp. NPDC091292 TaxID=3365991 RepID=UPI003812023F
MHWSDGCEPGWFAVLPDCPADNGRPIPYDEACTLFSRHPGGHSFELDDPEADSVRETAEYRLLKAELDALFRKSRDIP